MSSDPVVGVHVVGRIDAIRRFWQGAMYIGIKGAKLETFELEVYQGSDCEAGNLIGARKKRQPAARASAGYPLFVIPCLTSAERIGVGKRKLQ